jgi:hypothetical protein
MRAQRLFTILIPAVATGLGVGLVPADAQEYEEYPIEARVWLDRGQEPVLQRGEGVRVYYRTSEDAFVAIFHIDTNGTTRLVFPSSPQENHYARGGRDYRVLFPGSSYWYVDDDPGMGYFFIVASLEPLNFADLRYSHYAGGWDLSFVGSQVYTDPYLAMDDYVATLIPDWEYVPYGLDFTAYHVEQRYDYPRFMCYDCHGFRPFYTWNPYLYACTSFRVVIYNDPYYYPVTRYRGTRVVYVQPRRGVAHFGFKERADGEPWTPQIVVRDTPPAVQPGVAGTANRRAQPREPASPGSASNRSGGGVPGSTAPGVAGSAVRRPGASGGGSGVVQTPPSVLRGDPGRTGVTSPTAPGRPIVTPPSTGGTGRPVVQGRPTSGSTATPRTAPPKSGTVITRPSARVKSRGGGGASTATVGSGGSRTVTPPTVRSGGSGAATRPTVSSGGSRTVTPPPVRSGGSGTATRPTVRSGGSGTVARPPVRSGGSGATTRPTVRSGGSGTVARPPVRSGGSGATARPTVRSGGSGSATRPPPARTSRPPVRKRSGGGL